MFAATWQFHVADNEAGGNAISYWFGEWLVYGLFAYMLFRLTPRLPPGYGAVLAALVVVGGVNYKSYATIREDRHALLSLAKAAPLINKMRSGVLVSDQEVKDAQVGMIEPIMLAEAAYSRDVLATTATYTKTISGLHPELMLTPTSLASASLRVQTRATLEVWKQATADYKNQLDAATARGKLGIRAAQLQLPVAMAASAASGFDESSAQLSTYLDALVSSETEASGTVEGILDLMDASPGGYAVDKGPPVNLLFNDEATLARYRQLVNAMVTASQRDTEARARLLNYQSDSTKELTDLLKH
ncbi:hypothetical protein [Massilia sp. TSP1-1-2]|uniref:hypothetical protein n=1 Tax=Massilia sp. TSP1-1-2 TaxID=2804649 RepID=UPI003CF6D084